MRKIIIIFLLLLSFFAKGQNYFWSYGGLTTIYIWTEPVSEIGTTYVYANGLILDNGAGITERGIVVHTSINPTIVTYTQKFTDTNTGAGAYSGYISSLSTSTLYYVRAYATNVNGTVYGDNITFTTGTSIIVPQLNTTFTSVSTTGAVTGGFVNSDGGASVTTRGVCYSTSQNPTIAGSKVASGSGVGSFSATLTGLTQNTTYYARAYATNSAGTGYGNQIAFTTLQVSLPPIVETLAPGSILSTSATLGGSVISAGTATVTDRGVVYSIYPTEPNVSNTKVQIGSGIGSYSQSITGLMASTIYNVKAYAINSVGTSYGQQYTFQTTVNITSPIISTNNASSVNTSSAKVGGNITSDGGATVTLRGVQFGTDSTFTSYSIKDTTGTTGSYTVTLSNLQYGTKYYFRAFGTNSVGTSTGIVKTFTTTTPVTMPTYVDNGGISSSDSARIVMNYPTTVAATDLLIMVIIADTLNATSIAGWSLRAVSNNQNGQNGSYSIYHRKGETSYSGQSFLVDKTAYSNTHGIIMRFANASSMTDFSGTHFGEYCGGTTYSIYPNTVQLGCILMMFLDEQTTTITNFLTDIEFNTSTSDINGARLVLLSGTSGQYSARWYSCPVNQYGASVIWNLNK